MTADETFVMLACEPSPGWRSSPKVNGTRAGKIMRRLAKKGLFNERYEKANGLWWFEMTALGRGIHANLRIYQAAMAKVMLERQSQAAAG
jgi:hypothetical protein